VGEHLAPSHCCRVERELCETFVDEEPCGRWAVRAVSVAGLGSDGSQLLAERWASSWEHLPAAIDMASRWFDADGRGQVRLEHVPGARACERPGWLDDVDFFEPLYVAPHAAEVAS